MAEEGWTQGDCQAAPGFPSLLINALESLGVTELPRYYSIEYEHHGTLRCRVILIHRQGWVQYGTPTQRRQVQSLDLLL